MGYKFRLLTKNSKLGWISAILLLFIVLKFKIMTISIQFNAACLMFTYSIVLYKWTLKAVKFKIEENNFLQPIYLGFWIIQIAILSKQLEFNILLMMIQTKLTKH